MKSWFVFPTTVLFNNELHSNILFVPISVFIFIFTFIVVVLIFLFSVYHITDQCIRLLFIMIAL